MNEEKGETGPALEAVDGGTDEGAQSPEESIDQQLIQSIPVTVTAELGSTKIKLKELLRLTPQAGREGHRQALGYRAGLTPTVPVETKA